MFKYFDGSLVRMEPSKADREQHEAEGTPTGAKVAQNVRPENGDGSQALVMLTGKNDSKMYLGKSAYFFKAT